MNPFFQALNEGYLEDDIIGYISKAIPKMAEPIRKASKMGYNTKQIIGYLSKVMNTEQRNLKGKSESEIHSLNAKEDAERTKRGLSIAATAVAAPLAASAASNALSRALPNSLKNLPNGMIPNAVANAVPQSSGSPADVVSGQNPNMPQQPLSPTQNPQLIASQQPPANQVTENIPEPANIQQPEVISNPKEYLEKAGVLDRVKSLLKTGNTPEGVAAALGMKRNGESKIDPELLKNIEEYSKLPQETENIDKNEQITEVNQKISPEIEKQTEPSEEMEENIVATPNGFGEVKISRNGKSLVDVDGKKHQVEDAKILKPPKEAAIEAMELIKSFTPEEMRSTHHMLNSYDEEEKKGFFVFHDGSAYVVDDISPKEYEELSNEIEEAKTSGETIIGKWAKGHGSRGSAYNKIIKGHKDRKVVPELKKNFRKLKVGYNLLSEWQRLLNEK